MKKLYNLILISIIFLISLSACEAKSFCLFGSKKEEAAEKQVRVNEYSEIRKFMKHHLEVSNNYDIEALREMYSPNYISTDGMNLDVYLDMVKKTWESYPDVYYKMCIKNITVQGNHAFVEVEENASATSLDASKSLSDIGLLTSEAGSVYYLEKKGNKWLITSDVIIYEKTFLKYGTAKDVEFELSMPNQINAGTEYTVALTMEAPKDSFVIASIGREKITYPQSPAPEVFRKLPQDGILERIFVSNTDNINEYAVASIGITEAEVVEGKEIKVRVTGLGYTMSRVNVVPKNKFVKAVEHESDEKSCK